MGFSEVSFEGCRVDLKSDQLIGSSNGIDKRLYKLQYDDNHRLSLILTIS
jgi:hypothetical protein